MITEFGYKPLMVVTVAALALLMAVSHVVLAELAPKDADAFDERDRQLEWRCAHVAGYVLACGVFAVLVLLLLETPPFYVANALLLAWVLAEVVHQAVKIWLYARTAG